MAAAARHESRLPRAFWPMTVASWAVVVFLTWTAFVGSGAPAGPAATYALLGWLPWIVLPRLVWPTVTRAVSGRWSGATAGLVHLAGSFIWLLAYTCWIVPVEAILQQVPVATVLAARVRFWIFVDWVFYGTVVAVLTALALAQAREVARRAAEQLLARQRGLLLAPHFLFNALNGINGLIRGGEGTLAADLIDRLAVLLRVGLEGEVSATVSLTRELALAQDYLDIQSARFGIPIRLQVDVPLELAEVQVPPLLLQPVMENAAVRGGVIDGVSRVEVRARQDEGAIRVEVVNAVSDQWTPPTGHGLGLDLVRSRLALLHGPEATVACRREGEWFRTTMCFPRSR